MIRFANFVILPVIIILFPALSMAGDIAGFISLDGRLFLDSPQFEGQRDNNGVTLVLSPEYYHVSDDRADIFTFQPFARIDPYDSRRRHVDIRQAEWIHATDGWELKLGIVKEFWGVIESKHLVDIINQTDMVEDVDGEDKLGQPMVQVAFFEDWGVLRLYYLPYFRERSFAGVNGRLRGSKVVDVDGVSYESSAEEWSPDFAARYSYNIGSWDIGVAHFYGTSREPILLDSTGGDGKEILKPYYKRISQTSADIQLTTEEWLWKFEGISRGGQGKRFYAASLGFEYSFYNISDSGADIGVLMEYHRDARKSDAPENMLDNDIFIGSRLVMNDIDDSKLLAGVMIDTNNRSRFYSLEASKRFGDSWWLELDIRLYGNIRKGYPEYSYRKDDHLQLRIARYF